MGVSLVPLWSGLNLDQPGLEANIVDDDRYARKIVLVSPVDSTRPRIVEVLAEALRSSQA